MAFLIPAPRSWATLVPTDQPVASPCWQAIRHLESGHWVLHLIDTSLGAPKVRTRQVMVVDDFGNLALLDNDTCLTAWMVWTDSEDFEAAGRELIEARMHAERMAEKARREAADARALLKPQPVRVVLDDAPALHPSYAATIDISHDVRTQTPTYRITASHQVLVLTHAQLAALMLAGQQICAAAQPPAGGALQ